MRKSARALLLIFLAFVTSALLAIGSAFVSALAFGATALIVPGTGTPNANIVTGYMANARDRFMTTTTCIGAGCTLTGINYPASFWPLGFIGNWCPGYQCDTWNESVGTGVANLDQAISNAPNVSDSLVVFGYSQGGAVVSDELRNLANNPALLDKVSSAVVIGNIKNPDGGLWSRLSFLPTIPILNVSFGPAMPTDVVHVDSYGFQYDPVMYAPLYITNPFSFFNALAAFETVHGNYLTPNGNSPDPMAYGYTDAELAAILATGCPGPNCRVDSHGNTYWMIPAKSLPIADLALSLVPAPLTPIVKPFVDLIAPTWKVLADLGYDWSGDPGVVKTFSILPFNPFQNWVTVGLNLVAAAGQGIQAFLGDLGVGTTMIAPVAPEPSSTLTVSTLAARSGPTDTPNTLSAADTTKQTLTTTDVVQKSDETVVAKTGTEAVEKTGTTTTQTTATETKSSKTDDPPTTKPAETKPDETKPDETKLDETTKSDETKGTEEIKKGSEETKKDDTKKDSSNGSVSLNFSPKKTTEGETGGAPGGQSTTTATTTDTTSSTSTSSERAAA